MHYKVQGSCSLRGCLHSCARSAYGILLRGAEHSGKNAIGGVIATKDLISCSLLGFVWQISHKNNFFVLASGFIFNLRYYDTFFMEIRPKSDIKDAHPDGEVCDPRPPVPAVEPPLAPRSFGKP